MFDPVQIADAVASPLFVAHALANTLCLAILTYGLRHRGDYPSANCFVAWVGANVAWMLLHVAGLTVDDPALRLVADGLSLAAVPIAATFWLLFALIYSGRWQMQRSRPVVVLATFTLAVSAFVATNPVHGLVYGGIEIQQWYGASVVESFEKRLGYWVFMAYVYPLYLAGVGVLLSLVLSGDRCYRDQAAALAVAVTVPLVVATLITAGRLPLPTDLTPLSFGVSSIGLAYAVFRRELLELIPASLLVGERTAIETLDQGVLVVDARDRVVFANANLASLVGSTQNALLGAPLATVFEDSPLEPAPDWTADGRREQRADGGSGQPGGDSGVPSRLRHADSGRIYEVTESQIRGGNEDLGRTLFLRDVTEKHRRKQRLLVLNRVVRHNLRNDMNVLRGHVRLLEDRVTDGESVAVIDEIATDLIHLGEKAHQMDRIVREASGDASPVNVAGIVDRVVDSVRTDAGVPVSVDTPGQAWTRSHGPVVQAIVSNLVENAVEHAPPRSERDGRADPAAGDPGVTVSVETDGDAVTLVVADDGPGIPEQEVATLMEGEVSALHHGSGIGLWMVKWCVDLANADWEIETGDGTRVTVTFRGVPERASGDARRADVDADLSGRHVGATVDPERSTTRTVRPSESAGDARPATSTEPGEPRTPTGDDEPEQPAVRIEQTEAANADEPRASTADGGED